MYCFSCASFPLMMVLFYSIYDNYMLKRPVVIPLARSRLHTAVVPNQARGHMMIKEI